MACFARAKHCEILGLIGHGCACMIIEAVYDVFYSLYTAFGSVRNSGDIVELFNLF